MPAHIISITSHNTFRVAINDALRYCVQNNGSYTTIFIVHRDKIYYVIGYAKASHVCTQTEIHFIAQAYS